MQEDLRAGATTLRLCGDRHGIDLLLRRAVDEGRVVGPRLIAAGRAIRSPRCAGGAVASVLTDDPDEIDRAAAANLEDGADFIKVFVSDGVGDPAVEPTTCYYGEAHVAAAARRAHDAGRRVAAHRLGGPGVAAALGGGLAGPGARDGGDARHPGARQDRRRDRRGRGSAGRHHGDGPGQARGQPRPHRVSPSLGGAPMRKAGGERGKGRQVAVIGLGEMGLPMARNLIGRGFTVAGYDVREEACRAFSRAGGRAAAAAGEAVRGADAIVVMVRTPAQAEQVGLGGAGVLGQARSGAILIVMSTIGVAAMRRLGAAARERGYPFLDAPVSGGRERAEDGTLTIIVGAAAADLAAARPVLESVGSRIEHVGDVGAGTAVKVANQVLLSVSLLAAREVAGLAGAEGVSSERLWEVLRTCTGTTWVVEQWATAAAWVDGYRPGTSLDILVKDTGLALDLAAERKLPVRLLPLTAEMMAALTRDLGGVGR